MEDKAFFQLHEEHSQITEEKTMTFNASGWLYVFQIGVVQALQEHTELGGVNLHGTSAGAAAAAAIALDFSAQMAAEEMCQQEIFARKDFASMVPLMKEGLERFDRCLL